MSEIDDIFASKGKAKEVLPVPEPSLPVSKNKKRHKKKRSKIDVAENTPKENAPVPKKRPLPETIVDPSILSNNPKRYKTDPSANLPLKRSKPKKDTREENQFKDSRGNESRRQTEEGWTIYKEEELRLNHEGGETPLCPFDCDCCF